MKRLRIKTLPKTAAAHMVSQGWRWALLLGAVLAVILFSLLAGDLQLTPREIFDVFDGSANEFTSKVVLTWRLPRVITALVFGAALGAAGSIFQQLTRNPLGSPDVIGFNTGAYTGVLFTILMVPAPGFFALTASSLTGGLVTAGAVLALSSSRGAGMRGFILTGIAISAFLSAINTWLMYKTDIATATQGALWAAGTLDNMRWEQARPAFMILLVVGIGTVLAVARLRILALGDDLASALGLNVKNSRLLLIIYAVLLTAITTAVAGPILFISLVAPHIAQRLLPRVNLVLGSVAAGALLLGGADWIAAHAVAPTQLPVGTVTVILGGTYLTLSLLFAGRRIRF
jgi:iron complex transport system permease protein